MVVGYMKINYSGDTIINHLASGAVQIIQGERVLSQGGRWVLLGEKYQVSLYRQQESRHLYNDIPQDLGIAIDWKKVQEKVKNSELEENDWPNNIIDLLIKLEIITIDLNPNVMINGQPQQTINIKPEYQKKYTAEVNEIIDITEQANPRSENEIS